MPRHFNFITFLPFQSDAEKMYRIFKAASAEHSCRPGLMRCGLCGDPTNSFKILSSGSNVSGKDSRDMNLAKKKVRTMH